MQNVNSFLAQIELSTFAIIIGVVSLVFLICAIFFIWWVDSKKKPFKEFWSLVGDGFVRFFRDIGGLFRSNKRVVKTVYSDKSLNYSGTEFLPIPTKAPTNQFIYEFVGWDKNGVDEEGNTVVRAIYLQKVTVCKISVYDSDKSTILATYNVEYGSGINLEELKPQKNDTKEFAYEFVGWDKKLDAFYKDEKVYPVFNAVPKKYTYKFLEEDGQTVVSEGIAIYGTPIIAPSAPQKAPTDRGLFEFAGWKGYDGNTILIKDMQFIASYDFKPYGGVGSSSIIKKTEETLKVVEETALTPEEDSHSEEIKKIKNVDAINFDTLKDENQERVTEIKVGSSGIIRKRQGGFVQMNNTNVEKFKRINTGVETANTDKEVHQKIQLMTVKKSADVAPSPYGESKIITVRPKKSTITEDDILNNMMINKIKIEKNQKDMGETAEKPAKTTKPVTGVKVVKLDVDNK